MSKTFIKQPSKDARKVLDALMRLYYVDNARINRSEIEAQMRVVFYLKCFQKGIEITKKFQPPPIPMGGK